MYTVRETHISMKETRRSAADSRGKWVFNGGNVIRILSRRLGLKLICTIVLVQMVISFIGFIITTSVYYKHTGKDIFYTMFLTWIFNVYLNANY